MSGAASPILRALIVDDEPPAQRRLGRLLEATGRVALVAVTGSVEQALETVGPGDIDVAFLDIHMPLENGFAYIEKVPFDVSIIFVTAYSKFAVRAFDVAALDYLLKPVDPARLDIALDRVTIEVGQRAAKGREGKHSERERPQSDKRVLCLPLRSGVRFIPLDAIVCVLANDDYTQLILKDGRSELIAVSMQRWEEKLPPGRFTRVHRSAIAATALIERIERRGSGWQACLIGRRDPIPVNRCVARRLRSERDL